MVSEELVEITKDKYDVEIDIRYATANNVTGKPIYKKPGCFLHKEAANRLQESIKLAAKEGFRFKIFDAFRPKEGQQALWDFSPNEEFVSNPETGSCPHCRGVAIDLTLIDKKGREIDMGTGFDDFTPLSHHGNIKISYEAQMNRMTLIKIMTMSGWDFYKNEWWHYQLFEPGNYKLFTDKEAGTEMI